MFLALEQDIPLNQAVPIKQLNNHACVVKKQGQTFLLSNICPHQNVKIADCATSALTCCYHGKQFDLDGNGINTKLKLSKAPVYINGSLLFDQEVLFTFPVNLQHMVLDQYRVDQVRSTPNYIMDVFLDIDHIPFAHAGVYDRIGIVNTRDISVDLFDNGSIQLVHDSSDSQAIESDTDYNFSACWMAIYPGTMIEWQPGSLFVTVATPGYEYSNVHVFKYSDTRYSSESYDLNSEVWETAWEQDRYIAERMVSMPTCDLNSLKVHYNRWLKNAVR